MGRPSRPWWWKERRCWAATVGGRRHKAPPEIKEKDKHAAYAWHKKLLEEQGGAETQRGTQLTFRALCELYLAWDHERVSVKQRTREGYQSGVTRLSRVCDTRINGRLIGDKLASKVTTGDLDEAISVWRIDGRAEGYIVSMIGGIRSVFRWAKSPIPRRTPERLMAENPIEGYQGPPVPQAEARFAETTEAAAWLRWLRSRKVDRSFILLQRALIRSGARPSEMVRARWHNVELDGWKTDAGHVGAIVTLKSNWKNARKTGKLRRIYLLPAIRRSLLNSRRGMPYAPDAPLFVNAAGRPWSSSVTLGNRVKRQRDAAIRDDRKHNRQPRFRGEGPEKLVNYLWRHTAISKLIMMGVDVPAIADLMGTSPKMIYERYGHLIKRYLAKAASKLGGHL